MGKEYTRELIVIGKQDIGGPLVLAEDMESLFNWTASGVGAGYSVAYDNTLSFRGAQSLKCQTTASTPASYHQAQGRLDLQIGQSKRLFLDARFRFHSSTHTGAGYFILNLEDPTLNVSSGIKYYPPSDAWYYLDEANSYTAIPGGGQALKELTWHRMRLLVDFHAKKYVSLQVNSKLIDLSALQCYSVANPLDVRFSITLGVKNEGATQTYAHFDDLLVTEA